MSIHRWTIQSHIGCFVQGEVLGFRTRASWASGKHENVIPVWLLIVTYAFCELTTFVVHYIDSLWNKGLNDWWDIRWMPLLQTVSYDISIHPRHLSVLPAVVFHPCCWHDIQTTAAVFYLSSGRSIHSSLYSRQADVSGFWCHRLERPASPCRICAITFSFRTATRDLSVFPFLPIHYHMTHVLLLTFITTVWTPNKHYFGQATLKMFMMMMMVTTNNFRVL